MTFYNAHIPHTLSAIPSGVDGVKATLRAMVKLARAGKKDMGVRDLACKITRYLPSKDYRSEVNGIFVWVKKNIRYVGDIRGVETLQTAKRTLEQGSGDCDDHSVLLASLLESINHPCRFVALGFKDGPYAHVICETKLGSTWVALDTTVDYSYVGWLPPKATRVMTAHI